MSCSCFVLIPSRSAARQDPPHEIDYDHQQSNLDFFFFEVLYFRPDNVPCFIWGFRSGCAAKDGNMGSWNVSVAGGGGLGAHLKKVPAQVA